MNFHFTNFLADFFSHQRWAFGPEQLVQISDQETCWVNRSVEILVLPRSTGHMLTSFGFFFLLKLRNILQHSSKWISDFPEVLNLNRLFLDKTQAVHCLWLLVYLTSLRLNPLEHSPSPGCILYKLILTLISNFCQEQGKHDTVVMTVNYESFEWFIPESGCWHKILIL